MANLYVIMQQTIEKWCRAGLLLVMATAISACTTTHPSKADNKSIAGEPRAGSVTLKQKIKNASGQVQEQLVEKALFSVVASPGKLLINGVQLVDVGALADFLTKQDAPVLMLSAHRCLNSRLASQILTLMQSHTQTPIPYESHGSHSDAECL